MAIQNAGEHEEQVKLSCTVGWYVKKWYNHLEKYFDNSYKVKNLVTVWHRHSTPRYVPKIKMLCAKIYTKTNVMPISWGKSKCLSGEWVNKL